jgi:succinyl-CoA synthetase alpha subunit
MSILIDENTKYIIQGITGKEGQRAAKFMVAAGSQLIGGVRPGKAGEEVEGVKVYDAVKDIPDADCSVITVPPQFVKDAVQEAVDAGIKLIIPIAEGVPLQDTAWVIAYAESNGSRILGPNTVGLISPSKKSKAGVIGGEGNKAFMPGPVGIISKSGGMTSETARLLTQAGIGQSTCINIGGDKLIGTDIKECLELFAQDDDTKVIVLFGEIGGTYEEQAAEFIQSSGFTKPVIAFISGKFAERWKGVSLGHAGAIIEGNQGTRNSKVLALEAAGVTVVDIHHELVNKVKEVLN